MANPPLAHRLRGGLALYTLRLASQLALSILCLYGHMTDRTVPNIVLNNNVEMPQLGLGVWQVENGTEVEQSVRSALERGYRLIDTAAAYGNEAGVGKAIAESNIPREELFITTKLWNSDQGKREARAAFETSLEKLGLDYVDLYLIHWPMPAKNTFLETWKVLEDLQQEGKIRAIGVSNFRIQDLETLFAHANVTPAVNQIELHPYFTQTELRAYCAQKNIQVESWSPIGGSKGSLLHDNRLIEIAKRHGKSPAQIVIRWHIQNGLIVIPKSTHEERIAQNIDVFNFELSAEELADISNLDKNERVGPDPATMNVA